MRFRTFDGHATARDEFFSLSEQKSSLGTRMGARAQKRTLAPSSSMQAVDVRRRPAGHYNARTTSTTTITTAATAST
jgi:hypothetical protein